MTLKEEFEEKFFEELFDYMNDHSTDKGFANQLWTWIEQKTKEAERGNPPPKEIVLAYFRELGEKWKT